MKILIVGGGVAGTALAGLLKDHAEITLIDHAPKWGDIGYAIGLWGNGRHVLQKLGIDEAVAAKGYEIPWDMFEDSQGDILKQVSFRIFRPYGATIIVTRTDLHTALISTLGKSVKVKFGITIRRIRQRGGIATVTFSDGRTEAFDLVVGADGIHSKVRELIFGKAHLKDYGWTVYAFWAPHNEPVPKGAVELGESGKMYIVYPMQRRAVVMLAVASNAMQQVPTGTNKELLRTLFAEFDKSVISMIEAVDESVEIFQDTLSYVDMPAWHKDRVVLVGDAQHAISPITGMGSSMALEDALVLSEELKKITDPVDIPAALEAYAAKRTRRMKDFRRLSDFIERWLMIKSPLLAACRDAALRVVPAKLFTKPIENLLAEEV